MTSDLDVIITTRNQREKDVIITSDKDVIMTSDKDVIMTTRNQHDYDH